MSYTSPHDVRDFLTAAALRVVHRLVLHCQGRDQNRRLKVLASIKEIDLCSQVAEFFGPSAHLGAQSSVSELDLTVDGPTIKAELKYLRNGQAWTSIVATREKGVRKDWDWLLRGSSTNKDFSKRAWVVFWPSTELYTPAQCVSCSKTLGGLFARSDIAPFLPFFRVRTSGAGNHALSFRSTATSPRIAVLRLPFGKRVRVDRVGHMHNPIWCSIYTRITGAEDTLLGLPAGDCFDVNDDPIQP